MHRQWLVRQIDVLASDAPPEKRLLALKYVVHLAADIHQPLHAGFGDDRGGNSYQVQALGKGTNLHALWDGGLGLLTTVPHADPHAAPHADLEAGIRAHLKSSPASGVPSVTAMAEGSCRLASDDGLYPPRHVPPSYVNRYQPEVHMQLLNVAQHLAGLLNQALNRR